jgi:hypothetical protein
VTTLADILVAHWSLGEASGTRADDVGSNDLTDNNTVGQTTGVVGNAALFVAANSEFLSLNDNADVRMGDAHVTICFFVKLTSLPAVDNTGYSLVTKDTDSPANSRDYTIDYLRDDGTPANGGFRFYINGGAFLAATGAVASTGVWYPIRAWHDPDANTINLQVGNGSIISQSTGGTAPETSSAQFRIGARQYSGFEDYADAAIDQVAIFKGRPLTDQEWLWYQNNGLGQDYATYDSFFNSAVRTLDLLPVRYESNPIISADTADWKDSQVYDFSIIEDPSNSANLLMYVTGMAAPVQTGIESIGLYNGTKANPYSWSENGGAGNGQVLEPTGVNGDFDEVHVRLGCVIYHPVEDEIWMYYTGSLADHAGGEIGLAIAPANDPDNFTRYGSNPILTPDGQGVDDGFRVEEPFVVPPWVSGLSKWYMIYAYHKAGGIQLRAAESDDGLTWTKMGTGDILAPRADGSETFPQWHQVRQIGSLWYMILEDGWNETDPYVCTVAVATHPAGPYFAVKFPTPFLPSSGVPTAFDYTHTATPHLFNIDGTEYLFYCGATTTNPYISQWSAGVAVCINPTNLTTVLEDSFTDTNGTALTSHTMETGPGWSAVTGTFEIQGNKAVPDSDANDDQITTDAGVANYILTATVTNRFVASTNEDAANIAFRWSDSSHFWLFYPSGLGGEATLFENTGSGNVERLGVAHPFVDNAAYQIKLLVNGASITCYIDDELIFVYNLARTNAETTDIGLRVGKASTPAGLCSWDSLVVQSFAEIAPATNRRRRLICGAAA